VARTRAQRRRSNILLTLALVATLLVLVFARDVARSAHGSLSIRLSENRSFAKLANALVTSENLVDQRLGYLLQHGATLSRGVLDARLHQIADQLPALAVGADLLRHPPITRDVNTVLVQLTEQRVDDYQTILAAASSTLALSAIAPGPAGLTPSEAQASLVATDQLWARARSWLASEPGHVTIDATTTSPGVAGATTAIAALSSAPSLAVTRGVGITAVAVTPSPLPAPIGQLILPPVSSIHLGVTVTNAAYVTQPVVLDVTLTPTNSLGTAFHQRMSVILGPTRSYAFVTRLLPSVAGERATLRLTLSGAPAGAQMSRTRSYQVVLSPAGA
jgi:hypothetical protein